MAWFPDKSKRTTPTVFAQTWRLLGWKRFCVAFGDLPDERGMSANDPSATVQSPLRALQREFFDKLDECFGCHLGGQPEEPLSRRVCGRGSLLGIELYHVRDLRTEASDCR